jgi:sigma-54 dependent transcriptional regulator, acetoin dehydrogenase operon transcriptional activator AcoR
MSAGNTLTRSDSDRDPDQPRPRPALFQVLDCARPLTSSVRYLLGDLREVELGRGDAAWAAREPRPGGTALVVRVPDGRMSSRHARIVRDGAGFALVDEGSKNGSFVNGARAERTALRDGDLIELGHTFFFFRTAILADRSDAAILVGADAEVRRTGLATLDPSLARQLAALADVSLSTESILVRGESGTGKEVVARAVHAVSGRAGAFVAVNCAALPETLIEAELFGHRKGAFSGAVADRPGLVRAADGGTLFLDEIGDLRAPAQAALLRVLQEREVLAIGATQPVPVDFRLVAATHRDLEAMVADGRFREDLYARLASFTLALPPVRERRHDLGILIGSLLRRIAGDTADTVSFDFAAARAMLLHDWPRNVRELEKTLGAALALARGGPVQRRHLPEAVQEAADPGASGSQPAAASAGAAAGGGAGSWPAQPPGASSPGMPPSRSPAAPPSSGPSSAAAPSAPAALSAADQALRDQLLALLTEHGGNVTRVARALGKTRMQIHRWAERFGIDLESFRP